MPHTCRSFLSLIFVFAWFSCFTFRPVKAQTTIDDAQSAFSFALPLVAPWNAITPSDPCNGCAFKPNASDILDGTWHDGSVVGLTGSLTFDGTGVSLFGVTNGAQTCAMTFVLDGETSILDLSAIPQSTVLYSYQYFAQGGLSSGSHTLSWTIETSVDHAVAVIDYAVVTSAAAVTTAVATNSGSSTLSSSEGAQTVTVTDQAFVSSPSNTQSSSSSNAGSLTSSQSNYSSLANSATITSGSPTTGSSASESVTTGTSLLTIVSSSTSTPASDVSLAPQKLKTATIVGAVLGVS
ncbi:hypothetical protein BDP27DRAFT_185099 [Rhodocollybia butyracea]|uniref:Uncharacterized protein n=1 Tax=Rhodocollybia butyracea TaxID=206335 RepID=A0A9P5PXF6_9AGAR|nr:hypothetical protein BDP27DRAFT_185099 [Rhodocollybia butyracea]